MCNNFILAGWTVFNCKINIFEIINLQLSNLDKSVDQPANSYLMHDYRGRVGSGRVGKFIEYINDGTNILNNKILWLVSNHETGL